MQEYNNVTGPQQEGSEANQQNQTENTNFKNVSPEKLDEQIKNEPDTERLRSEHQSVVDGENKRNNNI